MPARELTELWDRIKQDLTRARQILQLEAGHDNAIRRYEEFLEHNELELACDMLEAYAEDNPVSPEFWSALQDASLKMELYDRAVRYEGFAARG